jgi:predicted transport protein
MLYLDQVYGKSYTVATDSSESEGKNPIMVAAGKKAAATRAVGSYTFDEHVKDKPEKTKTLAIMVQEFVLGLDASIDENPKKLYVGYKTSQNILCMEVKTQKIILYIKLKPNTLGELPRIARDVTNIGHYGTGDLEFVIKNEADFEIAKPFIVLAYKHLGG